MKTLVYYCSTTREATYRRPCTVIADTANFELLRGWKHTIHALERRTMPRIQYGVKANKSHAVAKACPTF